MPSVSLDLPEVSFIGRSFNEYVSFFGLRPTDLTGRKVIDCAAGPSAFAAEGARRGIEVTAVDPKFNRSESALRLIAQSAFHRMFAQVREKSELFSTSTYGSIEAVEFERRAAQEEFFSDYHSGVAIGRYMCGALPALPFADQSFDLGLCAHLLFTYDNLFDFNFHVAALRELCRVAPREVRIHPVVDRAGKTSSLLAPVREALACHGIRSELIDVDPTFFRGATQTMVLQS